MRKMRKNAGFTLVEMLIVVAIIAILIAVSIPLVSNSLEKARKATDQANERAAKAEASIMFLSSEFETYKDGDAGWVTGSASADLFESTIPATENVYHCYYDAASGKLKSGSAPTDTTNFVYGKCTKSVTLDDGSTTGHENGYLRVQVRKNGEIGMKWIVNGSFVDLHGTAE